MKQSTVGLQSERGKTFLPEQYKDQILKPALWPVSNGCVRVCLILARFFFLSICAGLRVACENMEQVKGLSNKRKGKSFEIMICWQRWVRGINGEAINGGVGVNGEGVNGVNGEVRGVKRIEENRGHN